MAEENEEIKEEHKEHKKESKAISELKANPWIAATFVFAIVALFLLYLALRGGIGGGVSESSAEQKVIDLFKSVNGMDVSVDSIKSTSGMYELEVSSGGQSAGSVFLSKDGKYIGGMNSIAEIESSVKGQNTTAPAEIPKSDKPVANFYVFAYCPYGTQMEKALIPVYNLLKTKADINIVFIGAMHGEYEHVESLRQLCILKNYGKDKLFTYLDNFLSSTAIGSCNGDDTCLTPLIDAIYTKLSITKATITACMTNDAPALYSANEQQANQLGISSSPTVTINGVEASVGRSPALVQEAICSAFNTAPSQCSQTLSSTAASAGFGSSSGTSSGATC